MEIKNLLTIALAFFLISCVPGIGGGSKGGSTGRRRASVESSKTVKNSKIKPGYGQVLLDNPIILSGRSDFNVTDDFNALLSAPVFITSKYTLERTCTPYSTYTFDPCVVVKNKQEDSLLYNTTQKWAYDVQSNEFLQTNMYYHSSLIVDKFFDYLYDSFIYGNDNAIITNYASPIGDDLYSSYGFWLDDPLTIYSNCKQDAGIAYFSPSQSVLCLGSDPAIPNLSMAHDPSVLYHEMGHVFVKIMTNVRNKISSTLIDERVDLGILSYDEGASMNEGLADYFSYVITERYRFGEWALGRYYKASRPLSEQDDQHAPGISTDVDARLSYPNYITYDSNEPETPIEDIHLAGQTASHYLVALTDQLKTTCEFSHQVATNIVLSVLASTLAEMGDLTTYGSDKNISPTNKVGFVNFSSSTLDGRKLSKIWTEMINPMNYRRLFQIFAKHLLYLFDPPVGSGVTATITDCEEINQDAIEQLLDQFGLLLFKSYNDNGGHQDRGHSGTITKVSAINRIQTTLIPKSKIKYNPDQTASQAFIFDNQAQIYNIIRSLRSAGQIATLSPQITDKVPYNNSNGRAGPGEVVGVALNLYNDSNIIMGGVQMLANDWDHARLNTTSGFYEPCGNFSDSFPANTASGAAPTGSSATKGDCEYIARLGIEAAPLTEKLAPICVMQLRNSNETLWVSQDRFRDSINLETTQCLMEDQPQSCFIRVIPGAEQSYYSQINPHATWAQSLAFTGSPEFKSHNLVLLELSRWIPPGTTIDCRFRVRFTNCEDCFSDPDNSDLDDFLDHEYMGAAPFKIFHLQLTVID